VDRLYSQATCAACATSRSERALRLGRGRGVLLFPRLSNPRTQKRGLRRFAEPSTELSATSGRLRALADRLLVLDERDSGARRELAAAEQTLAALSQQLAGYRAEPGNEPYYTTSAFESGHHPLLPTISLETRDDVTRASFRLGRLFEGPPGCVHGGFIAYVYDSCMGLHNLRSDRRGLTGRLEIRYHATTPLDAEIDLEIETLECRSRRVLVRGRMFQAGRMLTQARGLFVGARS